MATSHEDVTRRLIREEIKRAFTILKEEARDLDGYESDLVESIALRSMARAAELAAETVMHVKDCGRDDWKTHYTCNCPGAES